MSQTPQKHENQEPSSQPADHEKDIIPAEEATPMFPITKGRGMFVTTWDGHRLAYGN